MKEHDRPALRASNSKTLGIEQAKQDSQKADAVGTGRLAERVSYAALLRAQVLAVTRRKTSAHTDGSS